MIGMDHLERCRYRNINYINYNNDYFNEIKIYFKNKKERKIEVNEENCHSKTINLFWETIGFKVINL